MNVGPGGVMRWCRVFAALVVMIFAARSLSAQVINGVVVLGNGATPASGVIVVAIDEKTVEVSRGLTNVRGEYVLRLPRPGRVSLKALRIGFKPTLGPIVDVAGTGKTDAPRIVLAAEAVSLTAVNVRDRETCRVNADTGLMVTRVWEEARKAMLSTQLEAGAPLFGEWIEYDQTLDSSARVVRAQRVRTSRNPTTHAFKSRPAAFLDTAGYIVVQNGEATYFAPDADVLLSDTFAAHHCFRLAVSPREAPDLIGVSFQPSRERRDARDIQGTLWLDRQSSELRTLEFQYTNLNEVATAARAGGRVEFLRLREGSWLISRWSLRMPQIEVVRSGQAAGRVRVLNERPVLRAVQLTGGEVTRVLRGEAEIYRAIGPRVAVQVLGTDSLVPAAAATLTLDGTDYRGVADNTGRIDITPVLAGRYRARVQTTLMDSIGIPPIIAEIASRTDQRVDSIRLPSPRDVLSRTCPKDSIARGEGMLYGRVLDERAVPVPQATVVATWITNVDIIGAASGDQLRHTQMSLSAVTSTEGVWHICGVPRERSMVVQVVSDSGRAVRPVTLVSDFVPVALVVRKASASANHEIAVATDRTDVRLALVEFTVLTSEGIPLPEVNLEVKVGGVTRSILTGPSGRAILPDVSPGVMTVRARRIGFKQGDVAARVDVGRNTVPIRLSEVAMPKLDTVRVVGNRVEIARHDEFETRRLRKEATASFTYDDIKKRNAPHTWQMLTGIPSLRVIDTDTGVFVASSRIVVQSIQNQGLCYAVVMVDGLIKNPDPSKAGYDMRDLPSGEEIHGIEVFAGAASIPLKYGGTGQGKWCAMIAIWTR